MLAAPEKPAQWLAARPRLSAVLAGAVTICGIHPFGDWALALWPLALGGMAGLIALTSQAQTWRRAALLGWLFGLGYFFVGTYWIATSFTYQANMPQWLGSLAVVAVAIYLAAYPALAALAAWLFWRRSGGPRLVLVLAFAACWIGSEWLRAWLFTGFAWNPLALAALGTFDNPGMARLLPWLGTYALSGLVVLFAGTFVLPGGSRKWQLFHVAILVWGLVHHFPQSTAALKNGTLPFTLVQPDIRQEVLDDPSQWEAQLGKAVGLGLHRKPGERRLLLWPESGVQDYLRDGYPRYLYEGITYAGNPKLARERIGRAIGAGTLLLTGTVDLDISGGAALGARNVVTALDPAGRIRGSYAKAHLVPYGEYLPMRALLEPLGATRLVPGSIDFLPGPGPRTVDFGRWGKAGVQICYEIVFSGEVTDRANRPDYLFNPSNDGWFGAWGPPQHLAQARLRAIEEGLPVLRATTTGISAVIDADGVVRSHVPRHVAGRLDGMVPPASAPTLFARLGNALALVWAALLLAASLIAIRRNAR